MRFENVVLLILACFLALFYGTVIEYAGRRYLNIGAVERFYFAVLFIGLFLVAFGLIKLRT